MDRRVLLVEDDPAMLKLLSRFLARADYQVLTATDGQSALGVLHREGPPIVISDWSMPQMSGVELCQAVRSSEAIGFVYIIIITADCEKERVVEALGAGANDFITKPFNREELLARVNAGMRTICLEADLKKQQLELHRANAELAILNRKLELAATTDDLTGLANRRHAMAQLRNTWAEAVALDRPLSCIMMDVDHFKDCNDAYGHDAGDLVLKSTAALFRRASRSGDLVCRMGGEEFLALCPNTGRRAAEKIAERFRSEVEANLIRVGGSQLQVTVSAGLAERTCDTATYEDLLKCADQALYMAKKAGRNRTVVFGKSDGHVRPAVPAATA